MIFFLVKILKEKIEKKNPKKFFEIFSQKTMNCETNEIYRDNVLEKIKANNNKKNGSVKLIREGNYGFTERGQKSFKNPKANTKLKIFFSYLI